MSEAVRKPRTRKKATQDGPTQEELIEIEVGRRVSAIIDGEAFDRMILNRMVNAVSSLAGCYCSEHPMSPPVVEAMDDAMRAACQRIERIAGNDLPPLSFPCAKCGD